MTMNDKRLDCDVFVFVGLCIDYMAHMARGYMVAEGDSPRHKVKATLATTGVAMTNAVVTSVLGIVMLSAAPSFAARTFFRSEFKINSNGHM